MGQIIDPNSLLIKTDQQAATVAFFNNLITQFCNAINGVGVRMDGYDVAEKNLVELGLANINSVLGPFLGTLQQAAQLGFLVAQADGHSLSLSVGAPFDLILTSDGAELFTPTRWLMALDVTDYTNWGILQLDSWVVQDLNLAAHCIYASKTKSSSSWQVTCGSGVLQAMTDDLTAANTAATNAQTANTAAQAAKDFCASVAGTISSGPVVSVAGKTGPVTLAESDIANLVSDLAARPIASYVDGQVATKQPLSSNLTNLAAMTLSAFIISFLGAANAAAALSSLGGAPLNSPTFTGAPKAPTPTAGDSSTNIATTAFLVSALPTVASSATIAAGTDNVQYATASGIAANYVTKTLVVNAQTGTTYTLQASDNGKLITLTNAAAITLTCPNNLGVAFNCAISQEGAGQVTLAAQSGGSLASRGSRFKLNGQYAMGFLRVASNSGTNAAWRLGGDLSA